MWLPLADSTVLALTVALIGASGSLIAVALSFAASRRIKRQRQESTQLTGWNDLSNQLRDYIGDLRSDVDECNEDREELRKLSLEQERKIATLEGQSEAQHREIEALGRKLEAP